MSRPRRTIALCLLLSFLVPGIFVGSSGAKEYRFPWHHALAVNDGVTLQVSFLTGSVSVSGYDGDSLLIDAVKTIPALSLKEARAFVEKMPVAVNKRGRSVTVTAVAGAVPVDKAPLWKRFLGFDKAQVEGTVDLVIVVPKQCDLTISGGNGPVAVRDLRGDVRIASTGGDITLSGIVGRVDVRSAGDNLQGDMLFGPVTIKQPAGQIALHLVEGDIKVRATTASMSIQQESGSVNLSTRSGDITLQTELDGEHEYALKTESGDVNLIVPATASGRFKITTEIGDIDTRIPLAIKSREDGAVIGQFGYGGAKITVRSVSGDVTIAQF